MKKEFYSYIITIFATTMNKWMDTRIDQWQQILQKEKQPHLLCLLMEDYTTYKIFLGEKNWI